jgi:hypothetical protein
MSKNQNVTFFIGGMEQQSYYQFSREVMYASFLAKPASHHSMIFEAAMPGRLAIPYRSQQLLGFNAHIQLRPSVNIF